MDTTYTVYLVGENDETLGSTLFVRQDDAYEYARYMLDQSCGYVQVTKGSEIIDRDEWLDPTPKL